MTKSITAVGFDLEQKQSDMIEKKLERIKYADDLIIDLILRVKHEKEYNFDIVANFRWGVQAHVTSDDFDFAAALNKVMDVLDQKIKKEKDKIQGR
ncbi:MAG: HPF/RaiA family ribosome-associated protein [Treponema sp.]|nr:HPF/RaiA family ribosome-associated protein [Candidatus Treponema merdequi]